MIILGDGMETCVHERELSVRARVKGEELRCVRIYFSGWQLEREKERERERERELVALNWSTQMSLHLLAICKITKKLIISMYKFFGEFNNELLLNLVIVDELFKFKDGYSICIRSSIIE